MHEFDLLITLAGGLGAALFCGYLTQRLGLSPIVGYLLAGVAIGPYTPGFVADAAMAEQLAEIGVILLMFGVGLQFHIEDLLAVRRIAIPGAVAQSAVATGLGAAIGHAVGWSWPEGLVFGVALSVASTVVLIRVLADANDLHTRGGHIAVGWLVVEDLFTVLALVLLPALVGRQDAGMSVAPAVLTTLVKVAALVAFIGIAGRRVIPALLDRMSATRSRELFTLAVLSLALGVAVGSAVLFGVSMALGAFLAGLAVGRSEHSLRAATDALPMRDAFAVLFFVSVGMLLDPRFLLAQPWLLAGTLGVVLIGKPLTALAIVRLLRYPLRVGLSVAIALAQIGEFSFILASLGKELGVVSDAAANTLVAGAIVSIVLNPLLYRSVRPVERWVMGRRWLWRWLDPALALEADGSGVAQHNGAIDHAHRAVIVGYGPTGRTVVRLLRENGVTPAVIELNPNTIRELRDHGLTAVLGDASTPDTLERAGVRSAANLILTSAGMERSEAVVRAARELNPTIRVLARANYLAELPALDSAGADESFSGEGEVALAFVEEIMQRLGATAEQIDRAREGAHHDLFGVEGEVSRYEHRT